MIVLKWIAVMLLAIPLGVMAIVNGKYFFLLYMKRAVDILDEFLLIDKQ